MSLATTIQNDLAAIADDMGNPVFTWQGEDFPCVAGGASESLALDDGGFDVVADLVLVVSRAAFTDGILPSEQQTLTYKGKAYRIARTTLDPMAALVRLACVSSTKGG